MYPGSTSGFVSGVHVLKVTTGFQGIQCIQGLHQGVYPGYTVLVILAGSKVKTV